MLRLFSNRYRVIESQGKFYPQFKLGLFGGWRFFDCAADTTATDLVIFIQAKDPRKAAHFATADAASDFIQRTLANSAANRAEAECAEQGLPDARVVKTFK